MGYTLAHVEPSPDEAHRAEDGSAGKEERMKALKAVAAVVALVVIVWVVVYANRHMKSRRALDEAHRVYQEAETPEQLQAAKAAYEAVLQSGATGEAKRRAEAGIAGCEAHLALIEARGRGSIEKHRAALEKMRRAKELSGDPDGFWAERIETFEEELTAKLGPTPEQMRRRLEEGKAKPFRQAVEDLEALLRWKTMWKEEGMHQGDAEREAIFQATAEVLRAGYTKEFLDNIAAAREVMEKTDLHALNVKAMLLSRLAQVERFDPEAAGRFRQEYAAELKAADAARRVLEQM